MPQRTGSAQTWLGWPLARPFYCAQSLCWLRGVHIFVMIYGTGLESAASAPGLGQLCDWFSAWHARCEVEWSWSWSWCGFLLLLFRYFVFFFGQQMLKASDRFFDNLIYGTSSSAWLDEVATCQLASTTSRSSCFGLLSLSPAFGLCVNCFWPHCSQSKSALSVRQTRNQLCSRSIMRLRFDVYDAIIN